jgi:hypothetical protein
MAPPDIPSIRKGVNANMGCMLTGAPSGSAREFMQSTAMGIHLCLSFGFCKGANFFLERESDTHSVPGPANITSQMTREYAPAMVHDEEANFFA